MLSVDATVLAAVVLVVAVAGYAVQFGVLKAKQSSLDSKVDDLAASLKIVRTNHLDGIEERLGRIEGCLGDIERGMKELPCVEHEKRLGDLEP